jgi:hypothetical protein
MKIFSAAGWQAGGSSRRPLQPSRPFKLDRAVSASIRILIGTKGVGTADGSAGVSAAEP